MQIILLAAWTSSRMHPLSDKSLLKICWKSIIQHQVETILSAWLNEIIFVCNKKNISEIKKIFLEDKKFLENFWDKKNIFEFVVQTNQEDWMKWAIESCKKIIKKDVLIVSSNDIVEKIIFKEIAEASKDKNNFWVICGKVVKKYFPGGYISLDKNWFLNDIVEKPGEWNEPSDKVNLVLHYWADFQTFNNKLETFHNSTDDAYELCIKFFAQEKCKNIKVINYKWFWQAVKYPWHLLILNKYFLNRNKNTNIYKNYLNNFKNFWLINKNFISKTAKIWKNVVFKGDWIVVENWVRIMENAVISGPVYIWENSLIWNNSLIIESSIWENCTIWYSTEITRSLIQSNINFHNNFIWDSIIDSNVNIWWWTVFWNLRLDNKEILIEIKWKKINSWLKKIWAFVWKNCKLWINISINPWIKIWENSLIVGWISILKNILKNSFIK